MHKHKNKQGVKDLIAVFVKFIDTVVNYLMT